MLATMEVTQMSNNVLILDAGCQNFGKGGELNHYLSRLAEEELTKLGWNVKITLIDSQWEIAAEAEKIKKADAVVAEMGSLEGSNHRNINKMLVNQVLPTCQLQMGMTELAPGSVWNTMPAHVHSRRMEAYFYFEIPEDHAICHFMGEVGETRHVWMKGDQAVLSPEWSIHSAAATHNYTFIWGMGGENLDYGDQDFSLITDLK